MSTKFDAQAYEQYLRDRINTLQFIGKNLSGSKVEIIAQLECGSKILIQQHLIPFNLEMELKKLVDDSLDHYQRNLINLMNDDYKIFH